MNKKPVIRVLKTTDIKQVLEVYRPFIESTAITPEFLVPSEKQFLSKIKKIGCYYPVLVCEINGEIIGYAYANGYRLAKGHQWSVETSIYVSGEYQGKGIAKILYQVLFDILKLQNFINVFAGIVLPNRSSEVFHQRCGFQEVGTFKKGIYKLGEWHDVKWYQLQLRDHSINPGPTKSIKKVRRKTGFISNLEQANTYLACRI